MKDDRETTKLWKLRNGAKRVKQVDTLGYNRWWHEIYNWNESVAPGWILDESLNSRIVHITFSLKRWHVHSPWPFYPQQKDQSGPNVMRELLHGGDVVLRQWLFCWFGSNLVFQVIDFLECSFRFAPPDGAISMLPISPITIAFPLHQCIYSAIRMYLFIFYLTSMTVTDTAWHRWSDDNKK